MGRRAFAHDYTRPGFYHITIRVADGLGRPLGTVVGTDADTAAVALTPVGEAVRRELLTAITAHYPMVTVDAHVVMPEHLHFILVVRDPIVTAAGRSTHLGQVIAGFKAGCNRAFWAATNQGPLTAPPAAPPAAKPPCALSPAPAAPAAPSAPAAPAALTAPSAPAALAALTTPSAPGGFAAGSAAGRAAAPPSGKPRFSSGRAPLFAPSYCDVMPIEPGHLDQQRAYILNNPRSRWLRTHDRTRLQPQWGGIDTALTPAALRGYLRRECPPSQATPAALADIERRLLLAGGTVACNSYGDRALLQRRLRPVVCHRRDAARFDEQRRRCLDEAARGAVLVSPRIAKGEQTILDEATNRGFPVILIIDNGFPTIYHPSAERIALCADGRLLLVTPWLYEYRHQDDPITVPFCKTMNCVAQSLARLKDSWWQNP